MRIQMMILFFLLIWNFPVMADELKDVDNLVQGKISFVFNVLKDRNLNKETRNGKIVDAVSPFFAFDIMAQNSLGSQHWRSINKQQQMQYTNLFIERTRSSFVKKLDLFTDETVEFKKAERVNTRIHVMTHLISRNSNIDMLYKFYKSPANEWKVYDLEIAGVSVTQSYRAQFQEIMRNGGINLLLKKLKESDAINMPEG